MSRHGENFAVSPPHSDFPHPVFRACLPSRQMVDGLADARVAVDNDGVGLPTSHLADAAFRHAGHNAQSPGPHLGARRCCAARDHQGESCPAKTRVALGRRSRKPRTRFSR